VSLYDTHDADCIVAETNQGGDMVEAMVKAAAKGRVVPYRGVTATRAKQVRAEPVAALYEQGKIRHARHFPEIEDQMCSFTLGFDRKAAGYSPDRVDALVWGFTELFPRIAQNKAPVAAVTAPPRINTPFSRR
jgi:phage terminase large subunit-like protein